MKSKRQFLALAVAATLLLSPCHSLLAAEQRCPKYVHSTLQLGQSGDGETLATTYAKHAGSNLNLEPFRLLGIDVNKPLLGESSKQCTVSRDCARFTVSGAFGYVGIDRRSGVLTYFKAPDHPIEIESRDASVTEAAVTAKAIELLKVTNPYLKSPELKARADYVAVVVNFAPAEKLEAMGHFSVDCATGSVRAFQTILLGDLTGTYNEKVSASDAKAIGVAYLKGKGYHRPVALDISYIGIAYDHSDAGATGHNCETYQRTPRYVWPVGTRSRFVWGVDHVAGISNHLTGNRLWLGNTMQNGFAAVDVETGKVLIGP